MLEDASLRENDFVPYTLITVDAVSGLVATAEMPLEGDDLMRECENIMSIGKVVCDWMRAPLRPLAGLRNGGNGEVGING